MEFIPKSTAVYMLSREDLENIIEEIVTKALEKGHKEEEQKLLTIEQTAQMLGVDRSTLWHWRQKGYLLPIKIGRRVLYRLSEIKNLKSKEGGEQCMSL